MVCFSFTDKMTLLNCIIYLECTSVRSSFHTLRPFCTFLFSVLLHIFHNNHKYMHFRRHSQSYDNAYLGNNLCKSAFLVDLLKLKNKWDSLKKNRVPLFKGEYHQWEVWGNSPCIPLVNLLKGNLFIHVFLQAFYFNLLFCLFCIYNPDRFKH